MGVLYYNYLFKFDEVFNFYEKVFEICRRFGCRRVEGMFYINIGGVYEVCGDYEKVLEYYEKSYVISLEVKDKVLEGKSFYFIGKVYKFLG